MTQFIARPVPDQPGAYMLLADGQSFGLLTRTPQGWSAAFLENEVRDTFLALARKATFSLRRCSITEALSLARRAWEIVQAEWASLAQQHDQGWDDDEDPDADGYGWERRALAGAERSLH